MSVAASAAALEAIERLQAARGPLAFFQSGLEMFKPLPETAGYLRRGA